MTGGSATRNRPSRREQACAPAPASSPSGSTVLAAYRRVAFLDYSRNRRSQLMLKVAKAGLYWQALRVIGQHARSHPYRYGAVVVLLLLAGLLGSLAEALAFFVAAASERRSLDV